MKSFYKFVIVFGFYTAIFFTGLLLAPKAYSIIYDTKPTPPNYCTSIFQAGPLAYYTGDNCAYASFDQNCNYVGDICWLNPFCTKYTGNQCCTGASGGTLNYDYCQEYSWLKDTDRSLETGFACCNTPPTPTPPCVEEGPYYGAWSTPADNKCNANNISRTVSYDCPTPHSETEYDTVDNCTGGNICIAGICEPPPPPPPTCELADYDGQSPIWYEACTGPGGPIKDRCDTTTSYVRVSCSSAPETCYYSSRTSCNPGEKCEVQPNGQPHCIPIPTCLVTTSPEDDYNMGVGATVTVFAGVTSGLESASVSKMRFTTSSRSIASLPVAVFPDTDYTDTTSPYSGLVTANPTIAGNTTIKAEADLSDGRTCYTDPTTDTDIHVYVGAPPSPVPVPTQPVYPGCRRCIGVCSPSSDTCHTNNGTQTDYYVQYRLDGSGNSVNCCNSSDPRFPTYCTGSWCGNSNPYDCTKPNCLPGKTCLSTPSGVYDYTCTPAYSIRGNVFIDTNPNGRKDPGEMNYPGGILISSNPPLSLDPSVAGAGAGEFLFPTVFPVTPYTITYNNGNGAPWGYDMTTPSSFTVTVGSPCSILEGSQYATCTGGNITELNFGISNSSRPWIQTKGADLRWDRLGFTNPLPPNKYTSLRGAGGMPGIIFSGASTPAFGLGQASADYNWQVGSPTYPDVFTATHSLIPTSYGFLIETVNGSGIAKKGITDLCSGGSDPTNCILTPGLANGVYWIDLGGSGNLYLNGTGPTPSYSFPAGTSATSKNFVILVNGNLNINEKIAVPVNSTAIFSAKEDIRVNKDLGEAASTECNTATHAGCSIEGLYSADHDFIAEGYNDCPTHGPDLRLNVAGTVVANAGRLPMPGTFVNNRTLCAGNVSNPSVTFTERPDFILNYPSMVREINRTWQDVAP